MDFLRFFVFFKLNQLFNWFEGSFQLEGPTSVNAGCRSDLDEQMYLSQIWTAGNQIVSLLVWSGLLSIWVALGTCSAFWGGNCGCLVCMKDHWEGWFMLPLHKTRLVSKAAFWKPHFFPSHFWNKGCRVVGSLLERNWTWSSIKKRQNSPAKLFSCSLLLMAVGQLCSAGVKYHPKWRGKVMYKETKIILRGYVTQIWMFIPKKLCK